MCRVAILAPSPVLTITIEPGVDRPEVHLHAGGQGVWVGRLAATLGADVTLCCALGGEPGQVLEGLLRTEPFTVRQADAGVPNGVYVHDRREGDRREIVRVPSPPLARHAVDDLYGLALGAGMDAEVSLLTGCDPPEILDADVYRRLAGDLRGNAGLVLADLSGDAMHAALSSGIDLLKISHEEVVADGLARTEEDADLLAAARELHAAGAGSVLMSRAERPAILVGGDPPREQLLTAPRFEALDHRGAGDSMLAAAGVGLARGLSLLDAISLGMAAGALNATRRGLGTGTRAEIERMARHVTVRPVGGG